MKIRQFETILYVKDQAASTRVYSTLFGREPDLDVTGMTEFRLSPQLILGLMPEHSIARIVCPELPHPAAGSGVPRCELYLLVEDAAAEFERGIECGANLVSPLLSRDWGHRVCYFSDPDGHVVAFAEEIRGS